MGDVVSFRRPRVSEKHKGKTLCKSGFHKWKLIDHPFDTKLGKLVTRYECTRCGKTRIESR